jgi:hypothetical protein
MSFRSLSLFLPAFALAAFIGCSGTQQKVDQHFIKGTVGQKYSELMSRKGLKVRVDYGELAVSEPLADGSTFHLHVYEYESGSSDNFGLWGKVTYSYKLNGFKVKDDVVQDWAYGLYTPPEKATTLFSTFEFGYGHKAILARIKKEYPDLVKTSTDGPMVAWRK